MRRSTPPVRGRLTAVRRTATTAAALILLGSSVAACGSDGPADTLDSFLTGWKTGDLSKVGFVNPAGAPLRAADVYSEIAGLSGDLPVETLVVSRVGAPKETGEIATSAVKVDWTLPSGAPWSYESSVRMTKLNSDGWRVIWEPAIVHTELSSGDHLEVRRVPAKRATIEDGAGKPLVTPRPVVTVAVDPAKVTDVKKLANDLSKAFKKISLTIDLSKLATQVKAAETGSRIDLVTLRRDDYLKIRQDVRPLPGTIFADGILDLAPTRSFARALLGTVDLATREDIDANPETVFQGDQMGHGGIQQQFDIQLRGQPGQSVVIARRAPDGTVSEAQIYSVRPIPGKPIKTTIDSRTQSAADAAVAAEKQPSALVAIKVSDLSVVAVANGPDGGSDDVALTGQVPPGSTFKMVSTLGLLQKRAVTADARVDCPRRKKVSGREFKNSNDMALGNVEFHTDFAESCNTAFVNLSAKLGADGLQAAGSTLGLGGKWDLGMPAFSGKVSPGDTPVELAAASFGQGKTVVSPLAMASATAAVVRGRFHQPKLVLDPVPDTPAADGPVIEPAALDQLRAMMREVVTSGTGEALDDVPGKPVFGKTGTAEFETGSPDTHAWFIGWQGDIAFAVMVQRGGSGADTAIPIVERFLRTMN